MSDLISRSDAIGAVKEERFPIDSDYAEGFMAALDKVEWILKEWLPSAQPETHEERTETHACDCISRQVAIDAHYEYCNKHPDAGFPVWSLKILEDLPSAQPEPCEDTISRQAVLDALQKHFNPTGAELSPDLASVLAGVGVVINTMPSSPSRPSWIPCSERLPEENGQYLITVKYVHVDGYDDIYAEHGEWTDGKWDMFCFGHCGKVENIIAWMPLPEPYREDGE